MIRAILFDMGGTLDGDGLHWQDRFTALYRDSGVAVSRETFDAAETRANQDREIGSSDFRQMIEFYVKWQLAHLGLTNAELEENLVRGFIAPARKAAAANVELLAELAGRGFTLGVVSNGCGNVDKLCHDFGYAPFLSVIVDSPVRPAEDGGRALRPVQRAAGRRAPAPRRTGHAAPCLRVRRLRPAVRRAERGAAVDADGDAAEVDEGAEHDGPDERDDLVVEGRHPEVRHRGRS